MHASPEQRLRDLLDAAPDGIIGVDEGGAYPTPAVHGPRLGGVRPTGDMARLEGRSDVLLFSSEALDASLEVMSATATSAFDPTVPALRATESATSTSNSGPPLTATARPPYAHHCRQRRPRSLYPQPGFR